MLINRGGLICDALKAPYSGRAGGIGIGLKIFEKSIICPKRTPFVSKLLKKFNIFIYKKCIFRPPPKNSFFSVILKFQHFANDLSTCGIGGGGYGIGSGGLANRGTNGTGGGNPIGGGIPIGGRNGCANARHCHLLLRLWWHGVPILRHERSQSRQAMLGYQPIFCRFI